MYKEDLALYNPQKLVCPIAYLYFFLCFANCHNMYSEAAAGEYIL